MHFLVWTSRFFSESHVPVCLVSFNLIVRIDFFSTLPIFNANPMIRRKVCVLFFLRSFTSVLNCSRIVLDLARLSETFFLWSFISISCALILLNSVLCSLCGVWSFLLTHWLHTCRMFADNWMSMSVLVLWKLVQSVSWAPFHCKRNSRILFFYFCCYVKHLSNRFDLLEGKGTEKKKWGHWEEEKSENRKKIGRKIL